MIDYFTQDYSYEPFPCYDDLYSELIYDSLNGFDDSVSYAILEKMRPINLISHGENSSIKRASKFPLKDNFGFLNHNKLRDMEKRDDRLKAANKEPSKYDTDKKYIKSNEFVNLPKLECSFYFRKDKSSENAQYSNQDQNENTNFINSSLIKKNSNFNVPRRIPVDTTNTANEVRQTAVINIERNNVQQKIRLAQLESQKREDSSVNKCTKNLIQDLPSYLDSMSSIDSIKIERLKKSNVYMKQQNEKEIVREILSDIFNIADRDKKGLISNQDAQLVLKILNDNYKIPYTENDITNFFSLISTSKQGFFNFNEFCSAFEIY